MSAERVIEALTAACANSALVFWNDEDGEFAYIANALSLPGVEVVLADQMPALQIKLNIERHPGKRWIIYSAAAVPEPSLDWLLDLRLRSRTFLADQTSMLLEDLGLTSMTLRGHLKERAKFLRAKERVEKLKRLTVSTDLEPEVDRKMLAVLCRADQPELFSILLRLFGGMCPDGQADMDGQPKIWQEVCANDLAQALWNLARQELGYNQSEPTLRDLLMRILATDFSRSMGAKAPGQLSHLVLSDKSLASNASVFSSRWRSDLGHYETYNALSSAAAEAISLGSILGQLSAEDLAECMTFEEAERRIIQDLKDRILAGAGANLESVKSIIARRRDGHWANPLLAQSNDATRALAASYDALEAAAQFFEAKGRYAEGFSFAQADDALASYQKDIFRFDQLYRRFNHAADQVEPMGWTLLHELRARIEGAYSGWFMPQFASAWAKVVEGQDGLLSRWKTPLMSNQQDFFVTHVVKASEGGTRRVYVVISDAFRYEAAEELTQELNRKSRFKAALSAQLGVLPSYTGLGMAALLPHQALGYKLNSNLDLMADGNMVSTLDQRNIHLAKFGGAAIKAEDLLALGKAKGREFVRDKKLLYVYHDRIDLLGDKQGSETKTFEAAADTLVELGQLVGFIINSLNGSVILLTADHGFIYQESPLEEADKSTLDEKPEGTLKAKKRYLLGNNLSENPKAWSGNTAITAGTDPGASLDFWIPKGASRFHFSGGARFVHGSAMPQEIVVPVITIRESESDNAKTRPVSFSLLGASNKVVTNTQRFEFIQTDPISERVLPRVVIVSLRDGERLISDEQTMTFDSPSQLLEERKRSVFLTILVGNYDRNKDYNLVAWDPQNKFEALRHPLRIDIAFANDF